MTPAAKPATPWWRHAVIYEIYVRSFQDSNGDGVGDLRGVTQRLGYLQALGVDAIWLTSLFPSPNADFGYDVSNYTNVAPEYGTLADWDELVHEANARGIKVQVDFVLNHGSDQHPWFVEARASSNSAKRDWFVWKDSAADGGPPTNWHNAELRAAMFGVAHFWLQRGASGFRMDATAHLFEDPAYPQDPAPDTPGSSPLRPWMAGRPESHTVLRELRALINGYPGDPVLLGESSTDTLDELVASYGVSDDEIQLPMNFTFARHWQRHVAAQQADAQSIYHWYRALLALRRDDAVFREGAHVPLESGHPDVLAFGRRLPDGSGAVVLLNFSSTVQRVSISGWPGGSPIFSHLILTHPPAGRPWSRAFNLAPFGVWMGRVDAPAG